MRTLIIVAAILLAAHHGALVVQTSGTPERFTAFAVNMGSPGPSGADTVEIVVERWSTDKERDKLMKALI